MLSLALTQIAIQTPTSSLSLKWWRSINNKCPVTTTLRRTRKYNSSRRRSEQAYIHHQSRKLAEQVQRAPSWLQPYYSFRDELAVEDGVVFRGAKIIVPTALRANYVQQLHKMHQSADSTLKLAKEYFYWPKMSEDIFYYVDKCATCNSAEPHQQKEPMQLHQVPSCPFEFVETDLFDFNGKTFIVLVDSYSGFFDFQELSAPNSKNIINFLKRQFLYS